MEILPGGPGASNGTCACRFFVPITFGCKISSKLFCIRYSLSVPTTSWYIHHWTCIHRMPFTGPHPLPKFWGKKAKATTEMTLTKDSEQLLSMKMLIFFVIIAKHVPRIRTRVHFNSYVSFTCTAFTLHHRSVSGTFDPFNVMCKQRHRTVLHPFLNGTKMVILMVSVNVGLTI